MNCSEFWLILLFNSNLQWLFKVDANDGTVDANVFVNEDSDDVDNNDKLIHNETMIIITSNGLWTHVLLNILNTPFRPCK